MRWAGLAGLGLFLDKGRLGLGGKGYGTRMRWAGSAGLKGDRLGWDFVIFQDPVLRSIGNPIYYQYHLQFAGLGFC
ncbi:hypothetical protein PPACK8108_LOCUS24764 [Phakopsora pachyrhizi]|uniref:Uncharacterized protein n=1 Tax=Phakopsora pachyrhizi TaxID=170000 RepID=A0AAV0BTA9_PHAPC|nr:hypothetical protein PPACK8108_LOCUS24764 [Phakopsora pachyrhizi]